MTGSGKSTRTTGRPLRVCYFGTYRAVYSRNRILIEGLRRSGVGVVECHEPLWQGIEDRVGAVEGNWKSPAFWGRVLSTYVRLIWKYYRLRPDYDVMVVGYPGQFDVFVARLISWLSRKPLVWDIFMSIYLIAVERGLAREHGATVALLRRIERLGCRLPDLLVIDTEEYAAWFGNTHGVPRRRFCLVPTGVDTDRFFPAATKEPPHGVFRVLYYGTFIPNHGVSYMIEAARILAGDPRYHFEFVGQGPDRSSAMQHAIGHNLTNTTFTGWLDPCALAERIAQADLCLGAFGVTPQSLMTVQNKIYECMAMAKPVLTGVGPGIRNTLRHGEHVYLCSRADARAIAGSIRYLGDVPAIRNSIAGNGYDLVQREFTAEVLGRRLARCLTRLLAQSG